VGRDTELRTARLLLRSLRATDVDDVRAFRDDPEFARFLPHIPQPFTRADAEAFVTTNMSERSETLPVFAVVLADRVIGTVNFWLDLPDRIATLGYAIARTHWGRGIAFEAAAAAIAWVLAEHDLTEIRASTNLANVRSHRVLEKLGMTVDRSDEIEVFYRYRPNKNIHSTSTALS
jgi:ribosomal-protein-alanine N-acetyltransferase